jgi:uncharacterized protein with HEPN domain
LLVDFDEGSSLFDLMRMTRELEALLGRDAWDNDRIRQLAVERLLEIIREAANSLSDDFRAHHPGIPWRDNIGLRVVLAHHYHRVDPGQVWVVAATEVPRLVQDISP